MEAVWVAPGAILIFIVLWDAFETVVLPRRVTRRIGLARLFYRYTWLAYSSFVIKALPRKRHESFLSYYGPLSLLALVGLWAAGLVTGYAFLYMSAGRGLNDPTGSAEFLKNLYFSGTTFFTLGLGDIAPTTSSARFLVVSEVGIGFAFLALIIGYFPSLNQSFSHREVSITLLDARAGSPPTAVEMLRRHGDEAGREALRLLFHEWERWASELLESHLSYPVLAYFRSQHENQSWLAALTAILDACALSMTGIEGSCRRQAERTFAMTRHAVVDLAIIFDTPPRDPETDRLSQTDLEEIRTILAAAGVKLGKGAGDMLAELRGMYEPFVHSLSRHMRLGIPPFMMKTRQKDNWETSAWDASLRRGDKHF